VPTWDRSMGTYPVEGGFIEDKGAATPLEQ
jgi:hypothetical protein